MKHLDWRENKPDEQKIQILRRFSSFGGAGVILIGG